MTITIKDLVKNNLGNIFVYQGQDFCVSTDEGIDAEETIECIAIGDGPTPKGTGRRFSFDELSKLLKKANKAGVMEARIKKASRE